MKQTKTIKIFEQMNVNEMASLKGGLSNKHSSERANTNENVYYVYIDGKRFRVTSRGIEPA